MQRPARSASAKRLTFQTLSNKQERKARSNAKLAHEHLVELSRLSQILWPDYTPEGYALDPSATKREWMN